MKVYKGSCASPGLVLGQVSRLEHHVETTTVGPFKPSRELQLLTDAIRTAQDELESMADRAAPSEQAIFQFQSMMLDDEGMMNEVPLQKITSPSLLPKMIFRSRHHNLNPLNPVTQ